MLIYHGILVPVEPPQIIRCENGKTCDFDTGFYVKTEEVK